MFKNMRLNQDKAYADKSYMASKKRDEVIFACPDASQPTLTTWHLNAAHSAYARR